MILRLNVWNKRILRFAHSILCSSNHCVIICGRIGINGNGSDFCKSLNFISYKYKICKHDLSTNLSSIISYVERFIHSHSDFNVVQSANSIIDFVAMRELLKTKKFDDAKKCKLYYN